MGENKLGVLASGRGSNLQSIMDACTSGLISARVAVVISDNKDAYALERARSSGIPAIYVNFKAYLNTVEYESKITGILREYQVDLVCLAGYMRLVKSTMLSAFPGQIINIHPSLLPAFPGLHAQEQAWSYGAKYSGCTVHFVDEGMDTGPIILQEAVSVYDDDTADSLADRILVQEHRIYTEAINLYCAGKLEIRGRKVHILD